MNLPMNKIFIQKHHSGHPWIFSNEIKKPKTTITPGEIVDIYQDKKFLGRGFYNPNSLIAIRKYSDKEEEFDTALIACRIDQALEYRKSFINDNSFRLIHSESDNLPGLIVDKYEKNFVIQIHCYGIELKKDLIVDALIKFSPQFIYEKSDERLRKLEGLNLANGLCYGKKNDLTEIEQGGIKFSVDIENGQKTGFFFDLREIREKLSMLAKDKEILDLFCYTGGFSFYAAKGGAKSVLGIDSSKTAIEIAKHNGQLNNFQQVNFECGDAFDFLRDNKKCFDIIILDPPSFTKSKTELSNARRGYKEINFQAMKRLNENGMLITTCCSYHFSEEEFLKVINSAAADAGVNFRIIERATQALDHPVLLNMPESHYLKCYFLQRVEDGILSD